MKVGDRFRLNKTIATIQMFCSDCNERYALCYVHNDRDELIGRFVLNVQSVTDKDREGL